MSTMPPEVCITTAFILQVENRFTEVKELAQGRSSSEGPDLEAGSTEFKASYPPGPEPGAGKPERIRSTSCDYGSEWRGGGAENKGPNFQGDQSQAEGPSRASLNVLLLGSYWECPSVGSQASQIGRGLSLTTNVRGSHCG